jgi:hypothetical protein
LPAAVPHFSQFRIGIDRRARRKQFGLDAPVNSTGVFFEVVKRNLRILVNLDQMAVWIAHVATPFPAMVVERLSEKYRAFVASLCVTAPDVGDT